MNRNGILALAGAITLAGTTLALAAGPRSDTVAAFERLKRMAGSWQMESADAKAEGAATAAPDVTYRVTGGGKVVLETLFEGQPHEMVTTYYLDGSDLVLTHYCAAGNQPRMRLVPSDDPAVLQFAFIGGANVDPAVSTHMHEARLTFRDEDHVRHDWQTWEKGKPVGAKAFELTRRRK